MKKEKRTRRKDEARKDERRGEKMKVEVKKKRNTTMTVVKMEVP